MWAEGSAERELALQEPRFLTDFCLHHGHSAFLRQGGQDASSMLGGKFTVLACLLGMLRVAVLISQPVLLSSELLPTSSVLPQDIMTKWCRVCTPKTLTPVSCSRLQRHSAWCVNRDNKLKVQLSLSLYL